MKTLILLAQLSFISCAHHMGDVCHEGDAYCGDVQLDPASALICKDGKLARIDCPGRKGCTMDLTRTILCDQSNGAQGGQACLPEYTGKGQCAGNTMLQCSGGTWLAIACNPGQTCAVVDGGIGCK